MIYNIQPKSMTATKMKVDIIPPYTSDTFNTYWEIITASGKVANSIVTFTNFSLVSNIANTYANTLTISNGNLAQSNGYTIFANLINAASDSAAALAGVPVYGLYRNVNAVQIRLP